MKPDGQGRNRGAEICTMMMMTGGVTDGIALSGFRIVIVMRWLGDDFAEAHMLVFDFRAGQMLNPVDCAAELRARKHDGQRHAQHGDNTHQIRRKRGLHQVAIASGDSRHKATTWFS